MRQPIGAGQGEPFGEGVEQLAELEPAHQRFEVRGHLDRLDRWGGVGTGGLMTASARRNRWLADEPRRRRRRFRHQRQLLAGAAGQHALDQPDVDDFGVQGAAAGVVDRVGAVAAHQPE